MLNSIRSWKDHSGQLANYPKVLNFWIVYSESITPITSTNTKLLFGASQSEQT